MANKVGRIIIGILLVVAAFVVIYLILPGQYKKSRRRQTTITASLLIPSRLHRFLRTRISHSEAYLKRIQSILHGL